MSLTALNFSLCYNLQLTTTFAQCVRYFDFLKQVHTLMSSPCDIFIHNSSRKSCMAAVVRMLQEFLNSETMNERRIAVLILQRLVQVIHDAESVEDAWNLSCMLPEIASCTAYLLQVREQSMSGAGLNGKLNGNLNGNLNEENGIPLGTTSSTNPGHIKHKLSIASR